MHVGGQAVLEGVMLRGKKFWVVSVRKQDLTIVQKKSEIKNISKKYPIFSKPIFRGVISLYEAISLGVEALNFSAVESSDEDMKISKKEIGISFTIAIIISIVAFIIFPSSLAKYFENNFSTLENVFILNLFEGLLRVIIFISYILAISMIKDIRRVFEYHGAEHKVIHAYEEDVELTTENVQKYSTVHVRCGTSFIIIVLILMIFVFSLLGRPSILLRILYRIILIPVIAGLSYEIVKLSGKHQNNIFIRILIYPGLLIQKLTTKEPDNEQVEVALKSLNYLLELENNGVEEKI
ncbi:MAG: DUF1385 domain-containing protein [Actinomycetia bacterium]|nr:DUF1385 domain-containing protein [Actinomycetes bacterium]